VVVTQTYLHTQIWAPPRVVRGEARNDKANPDGLALKTGGAEEDRTPDLRIANATLSQLSYRPIADHYIIDCPESQCAVDLRR
jgi:hypothetical protein